MEALALANSSDTGHAGRERHHHRGAAQARGRGSGAAGQADVVRRCAEARRRPPPEAHDALAAILKVKRALSDRGYAPR